MKNVEKWSKKSSNCINCKSTRRLHKARGLCIKCYPIQLKIEQIQKWDLQNSSTLKSYLKDLMSLKNNEFKIVKSRIIMQYQRRLDSIAHREEMLKIEIQGINLEYQFRRIVKLCKVKNVNMFHGTAEYFDLTFDVAQRKEIFKLMNEIEESVKWKGINWIEVFKY